jgi:hypothetical protein
MVTNVGWMSMDEIDYSFHFYSTFKAFFKCGKYIWFCLVYHIIVFKPKKKDQSFKHVTFSFKKMNIEE